jgi:hypothetical protein
VPVLAIQLLSVGTAVGNVFCFYLFVCLLIIYSSDDIYSQYSSYGIRVEPTRFYAFNSQQQLQPFFTQPILNNTNNGSTNNVCQPSFTYANTTYFFKTFQAIQSFVIIDTSDVPPPYTSGLHCCLLLFYLCLC